MDAKDETLFCQARCSTIPNARDAAESPPAVRTHGKREELAAGAGAVAGPLAWSPGVAADPSVAETVREGGTTTAAGSGVPGARAEAGVWSAAGAVDCRLNSSRVNLPGLPIDARRNGR